MHQQNNSAQAAIVCSSLNEDALYLVTFKNSQTTKMTGNCLIHCYLNNSSNSYSVDKYEVVPGTWYDVMLGAVKMWVVYAESADNAIRQRAQDLRNLGYTDLTRFTACVTTV
jgi:hypothetical protein